jgi:hypothetical protein
MMAALRLAGQEMEAKYLRVPQKATGYFGR